METPLTAFAEIQGLYGTITVSERLIQKLWLRGDFDQTALRTVSGKTLQIRRPGLWNQQEGPDFRGAQLVIDGQRMIGDVEIHFYASDWAAHQHEKQISFDRVLLHVVVFPSEEPLTVRTRSGHQPETLILLPYLDTDIETYASEEVIRDWERPDAADATERFLCLPLAERRSRLVAMARTRYNQKIAFTRKRLAGLRFEDACHRLTLEILGYRRNRAPMSAIADQFSPEGMLQAGPERVFYSQEGSWRLNGLRPANHPRKRLAQYTELIRRNPGWMAQLQAWGLAQHLREGQFSTDTRFYRKKKRLTAQRREVANSILSGSLGGTRLDTWMIDGAIPLLAVNDPECWFPLWFHWFPGDMPDVVDRFQQNGQIRTAGQPRSNGWHQGSWQFLLESGL